MQMDTVLNVVLLNNEISKHTQRQHEFYSYTMSVLFTCTLQVNPMHCYSHL